MLPRLLTSLKPRNLIASSPFGTQRVVVELLFPQAKNNTRTIRMRNRTLGKWKASNHSAFKLRKDCMPLSKSPSLRGRKPLKFKGKPLNQACSLVNGCFWNFRIPKENLRIQKYPNIFGRGHIHWMLRWAVYDWSPLCKHDSRKSTARNLAYMVTQPDINPVQQG